MTLTQHLKILLASTFTIYLITHKFHWDVKGPLFYSLHKLFEDQYNELHDSVDLIAEKIRYLDDNSPGSMKRFMEMTVIEEVNTIPVYTDMILILIDRHDKMIELLNACYITASESSDQAIMNFIAERLDGT